MIVSTKFALGYVVRIAIATAILTAILSLTGCPKPGPTPVTPTTPDAATSDADIPRQLTCADFCQHCSTLGCKCADPSPGGVSCLDLCANVQNSGVISWDLDCRVRAASCPAIDGCP